MSNSVSAPRLKSGAEEKDHKLQLSLRQSSLCSTEGLHKQIFPLMQHSSNLFHLYIFL